MKIVAKKAQVGYIGAGLPQHLKDARKAGFLTIPNGAGWEMWTATRSRK